MRLFFAHCLAVLLDVWSYCFGKRLLSFFERGQRKLFLWCDSTFFIFFSYSFSYSYSVLILH